MSIGGKSYNGSVYNGPAADGPASYFALGTSTTYDAQRDFDNRFGVANGNAFPLGGVAVFRYSSVILNGAPTFSLKTGPVDFAIVSDGTLSTTTTTAFTWNLSSIHSLTLTSGTGTTLTSAASFSATSGSLFDYLHFYQRGTTGAFSLAGSVNMPTSSLFIDAPANVTLAGSSVVNVDKAVINAGQIANLNGSLSANFLQIWAGTSIQFKAQPSPLGTLFAYAPTLTSTTDLAVSGGDLRIGTGGIDMKSNNLTGFDNIVTDGNLSVHNVTAKGRLYVGGTLQDAVVESHVFDAGSIELPLGLTFTGSGAGAGGNVTLVANSILFDSVAGGINGANMNGGDGALLNLVGGDGGTLNVGTTATPVKGDVTFNVPVTATTGSNPTLILTGGNGGTVSVDAMGTVAVNSTIRVSDSAIPRASSSGGKVLINSRKTAGTAINVSSSAQLVSLLSGLAPGAGGTIKLTSAGGDVNVSGKLQADRGTVEVVNNGATGVVNVNNATLNASTVKVGALGSNGTLNVGGGTINADTTIKLYAGGSNGTVNFTNNVTLSGNSMKTIAGDTVNIFNGKVVTVTGTGPANVFTNHPNYSGFGGNGTTTGTFAGQGATTQPLSALPPGW